MTRYFTLRGIVWISVLLSLILAGNSRSQEDLGNLVAFDTEHWDLDRAVVTEYLDQTCIMGTARLKDIDFTNGVIEYDMAVDGRRCYPGVRFRVQGAGDFEEFYIRPHHSNDPAALQYTASFNGITGWQLYSGPGFTAAAEVPTDRWFHIKLEVSGTQARVFVDGSERPVLTIPELKHGVRGGALLLQGPADGRAYFANFQFQPSDDLVFAKPLLGDPPGGVITSWQISQPLPVSRIDRERPPADQGLTDLHWQDAYAETSGLVDIARSHARSGREPDCVLARTTVAAVEEGMKKFEFGYSDQISIFLNGKIVFTGNSAYRSRDPSFLGAVGLHDAVFLDLQRGDNELLLMVTESFGGWGFRGRITAVGGEPIKQHEVLTNVWESGRTLSIPESVVYDAAREVFYVSNYYNRIPGDNPLGNEFLSRVNSSGEIEELNWVTDLNRPTGQSIYQDKLFVVERGGLVEIDLTAGKIVARHPLPDAVFPNDVAVDAAGRAYVSDSNQGVIYRYHDGEALVWFQSLNLLNPNGLCIHDDLLLVGDSGDGCVKEIDLASQEIRNVAFLGAGSVIDGLTLDQDGNLLVTDWNGRLLRITPDGQQTELLNMTVPQYNCADIAYLADRQLVVIPTFADNRLLAYEVK